MVTSADNDHDMRLSSITLSTGACVFSLAFTYVSNDGEQEVDEFGGPGGTPQKVINLIYKSTYIYLNC